MESLCAPLWNSEDIPDMCQVHLPSMIRSVKEVLLDTRLYQNHHLLQLSSQSVIVLNLSDNKLQFPGDPFEQNPLSLSLCTTQYVEDIASDLESTNQIQHLNKRGKKELVHIVKQSSSISHQN